MKHLLYNLVAFDLFALGLYLLAKTYYTLTKTTAFRIWFRSLNEHDEMDKAFKEKTNIWQNVNVLRDVLSGGIILQLQEKVKQLVSRKNLTMLTIGQIFALAVNI